VTPAITVRPEAASDIDEAYRWYERARGGLGAEFLAAVRSALDLVCERPEQFPVVYRNTRRMLLRRFPYSLFYRIESGAILLVAVFHGKRDPRVWRARR